MAQQGWRDSSILVKISPHIHSGYQVLLSFTLLETSKLTSGFILNLHLWEHGPLFLQRNVDNMT